jgi:hypothetical protein
MENSMQLRIASVFIILVVSLAGVVAPFYFDTKGDEFLVLKTCSAGIMLGLALMHLLPEAAESLDEGELEGYAYAITTGGVVLVIAIEQLAYIMMLPGGAPTKVPVQEKVTEMATVSDKASKSDVESSPNQSGKQSSRYSLSSSITHSSIFTIHSSSIHHSFITHQHSSFIHHTTTFIITSRWW